MSSLFESVGEVMRAGGWVMWLLLGLSVVSVGLSIERALFWAGAFSPARSRWVREVSLLLKRGKHREAAARCADDASVYGSVARQLAVGLAAGEGGGNGEGDGNGGGGGGGVLDEAEAVAVLESVRGRVERFGVTMSTIITAAPMLGILGTVIGIIDSFRVLDAGLAGGGGGGGEPVDPAKVAGGIAKALYTTAFGLIVALLTLFPYAVFRRAGERCFAVLEILATSAVEGVGGAGGGGGGVGGRGGVDGAKKNVAPAGEARGLGGGDGKAGGEKK